MSMGTLSSTFPLTARSFHLLSQHSDFNAFSAGKKKKSKNGKGMISSIEVFSQTQRNAQPEE